MSQLEFVPLQVGASDYNDFIRSYDFQKMGWDVVKVLSCFKTLVDAQKLKKRRIQGY